MSNPVDEQIQMAGVKHFTPTAVAASHVAIATCVEEFARSLRSLQGKERGEDREGFADLLDEKFRELFRADHGLSPEDEHDLHRLWEALRKTLRSPTLKKYKAAEDPLN